MAKAAKAPLTFSELQEQSDALFQAIGGQNSLSKVLIAGAFLDQCLFTLLHGHFIKSSTADSLLSIEGGALGTTSSRAKLAYCLGLISKSVFSGLNDISGIRNKFAHSHLDIDFDDDEIASACAKLIPPKVGTGVSSAADGKRQTIEDIWPTLTGRGKFTSVVIALMSALHVAIDSNTQSTPKAELPNPLSGPPQ